MAKRDVDFRRSVASLARRVRSGDLSFFDFIKQIGGHYPGDELIDELIDRLEHEPGVGGWFGVDPKTHSEYVAEIERIIVLLDADDRAEAGLKGE